MSSARRIEANRLNSRKSTGPRSAEGKRRSSKNAVKHGLLVSAPVLPGVESDEDWIAYRSGIFESLLPVGYLEQVLAERVASLSWRLRRVARYETDVAEARIALAEADVAARHTHELDSTDSAEERETIEATDRAINTLENLFQMPEDAALDRQDAVCAHWAIDRAMPGGLGGVSVEGIPDDDTEYDVFNRWTWGLLKKCLVAHTRAAKMELEAFLTRAMFVEYQRRCESAQRERAAKARERGLRQEVVREQRERRLLEPAALTRVARYEAALERAFLRNLHELQRLQATRKIGP